MASRRVGQLLSATVLILAGLVIVLNIDRSGHGGRTAPGVVGGTPRRAPAPPPTVVPSVGPTLDGVPPRENPIGLDLKRNHMRIAAAWLPAVRVAGSPSPAPGAIRVVAHLHASEGNPHGFARGEWIPYLAVRYAIEPSAGGPSISGDLVPTATGDGPHYGANLSVPGPGTYRVTFRIAPPSPETFSRYVDPAMGVAPWWEPFEATFDWSYDPR